MTLNDIKMMRCHGSASKPPMERCPLRGVCQRHKAPAEEGRATLITAPVKHVPGRGYQCSYFVRITRNDSDS